MVNIDERDAGVYILLQSNTIKLVAFTRPVKHASAQLYKQRTTLQTVKKEKLKTIMHKSDVLHRLFVYPRLQQGNTLSVHEYCSS